MNEMRKNYGFPHQRTQEMKRVLSETRTHTTTSIKKIRELVKRVEHDPTKIQNQGSNSLTCCSGKGPTSKMIIENNSNKP